MTVATLHIRDDHSFDLFWEKDELEHQSLDVEESILPRRKTSRRIDDGITVGDFMKTYRQQYYKALDLIFSINDRFNQPGYKINEQI